MINKEDLLALFAAFYAHTFFTTAATNGFEDPPPGLGSQYITSLFSLAEQLVYTVQGASTHRNGNECRKLKVTRDQDLGRSYDYKILESTSDGRSETFVATLVEALEGNATLRYSSWILEYQKFKGYTVAKEHLMCLNGNKCGVFFAHQVRSNGEKRKACLIRSQDSQDLCRKCTQAFADCKQRALCQGADKNGNTECSLIDFPCTETWAKAG